MDKNVETVSISISHVYAKIRLFESIGPKPEAALLKDIDIYMSLHDITTHMYVPLFKASRL